jgi:pyridoxine 5-phosphate synthase
MADLAHKNNLKVNAGHGLNYRNISGIVSIKQIEEVSIGHSIVARAVMVGFEKAVKGMLELIKK